MPTPSYLPRRLASTLTRALRTFPAVAVSGPRQSGKTTLLREELDHSYVSLDRPDVRERALADPVGFFQDHPPPLIIDEIQHVPALLHHVKSRIDEDRRPGRWVLTGSQGFPVHQALAETLAGRVAVLRLDPLDVSEVTRAPGPGSIGELLEAVFGEHRGSGAVPDAPSLADWLLRGGFPELRLDERVDRDLWLSSYVQTYLQRDVRDLSQVGDLNAFGRFLGLVAARQAQPLNRADLARDAGVSVPTVRSWISVLEASGVLMLLPPWHRNLGKRITKAPRIHLVDPALVTWLQGLHTPTAILRGPSAGALAETAVIGEWRKAFLHRGRLAALGYWRSTGGLEVDLVIEHDGRVYGVEVKATATPTPRHAAGLVRWLGLVGPEARGVVACQVDRPMSLAPRVRAVPWHLGWA